MRQGTTPVIKLNVKNADLSQFARVVVTMKGNQNTYDFENDRLTITTDSVSFRLSQEETFGVGDNAEIQIRAISSDGLAVASGVAIVRFGKVLKPGVLGVEDG